MDSDLANPFGPTETITILGDLILPHPRDHFQEQQEWTHRILDLLPHIRHLQNRDLRTLRPRNADLAEDFKRFEEDEAHAWAISGSAPESGSCLTSPSGSLDAPLAHHLHQPSFATSTPASSEVADKTNPCIAMVMDNAFREEETLIYDHLHRRSKKSEGLMSYPENVIRIHEEFTRQIMGLSAAKVEIVYGKPTQKRLLQMMKTTTIPLWGYFQGVFLILLHEDNFENHDSRFMFRKVLLFAAHPQRMFYQPLGSATNQDRTLEAAVLMTDPSIKFSPTYFQDRAWNAVVSASYRARHVGDRALREKLYSLQEPVNELLQSRNMQMQPERNAEPTPWAAVLDSEPSSNERTRALLPAAISAIQTDTTGACESPFELPVPVLAWLKGQGRALFGDRNISSADDISLAVEKDYVNFRLDIRSDHAYSQSALTLKECLEQLMLVQQKHLGRIKKYKHDNLVFSPPMAQPIMVSCPCGAIEVTDNEPAFSCARPSAYVSRERMCRSRECNPKSIRQGTRTVLRPLSDTLEYVRATIPTLQSRHPPRVIGDSFASLLRDSIDIPGYPKVVKSWCIVCKGLTETTNGLPVYVDSEARWTIGNVRPLYVERTPRCLRCERLMGQAGRKFVPCSSSIPSISPRSLSRFQQAYQDYDAMMQVCLLDSYLPSARETEFQLPVPGHSDIGADMDGDGAPQLSKQSVQTMNASMDPRTADDHSAAKLQGKSVITSAKVEGKVHKRLRVKQGADLYLSLIRNHDNCAHLPAEIWIWCKNCKEKTTISLSSKYKSDGPYLIDIKPRWTVGRSPVYLSTRPECRTCLKKTFVPVDPTIPFIYSGNLRSWAHRHEELSTEEAIIKFEKWTEKSVKRTGKVNK